MSVLIKFNNKILKYNTKALALAGSGPDPYNPLGLPPYTIRLKFRDGVTPSFYFGTGVQVSSSPNVWDLTNQNTVWTGLCSGQTDLLEVLGANSASVTDMRYMFQEIEIGRASCRERV